MREPLPLLTAWQDGKAEDMVARTKNKAAVSKYMFLLVEILVRAMKKSILLLC